MSLQSWAWIHKWSSIVCTLFMLLLCLTGLPLIFHEEIEHLSGVVEAPPMPKGTPDASMDRIAQVALERVLAKSSVSCSGIRKSIRI